MKRSVNQIIGLLLFSITSICQASEGHVSDILKPFKQVTVFEGEFEQHKTLPVLSKPFVSKGEFRSVRDRGLVWKTSSPTSSTLIMMPGKVTQIVNGREQTFQASGSGYDGLAILLPALLDGDVELLESYFSLISSGDSQQWILELQPTSKELSSMVQQVMVHGGNGHLREISMSGSEGDLTRILFQSVTMSSEVPDAADLADFN